MNAFPTPFFLILTGTPGTGKSKLAQWLKTKHRFRVINDKSFAVKHKLGKKTKQGYVIPISTFKKKIEHFLKEKRNQNKRIVFEGHLFSEFHLKNIHAVIVLQTLPSLLEKRLRKRNYAEIKIQDNVFCEKEGYCIKQAKRFYPRTIPLSNNKAFKDFQRSFMHSLRKKGLIE